MVNNKDVIKAYMPKKHVERAFGVRINRFEAHGKSPKILCAIVLYFKGALSDVIIRRQNNLSLAREARYAE